MLVMPFSDDAVGDTVTSVVVKGKKSEEEIGIEKEGITTGRNRSLSKSSTISHSVILPFRHSKF